MVPSPIDAASLRVDRAAVGTVRSPISNFFVLRKVLQPAAAVLSSHHVVLDCRSNRLRSQRFPCWADDQEKVASSAGCDRDSLLEQVRREKYPSGFELAQQ